MGKTSLFVMDWRIAEMLQMNQPTIFLNDSAPEIGVWQGYLLTVRYNLYFAGYLARIRRVSRYHDNYAMV